MPSSVLQDGSRSIEADVAYAARSVLRCDLRMSMRCRAASSALC
jgi:hypothetical protein